MVNNGSGLTISFLAIAVMVVTQAFLLYRIFELDTAEQYSDIPSLLGITLVLYATILFIYLRVFIGVGAYKKILDTH